MIRLCQFAAIVTLLTIVPFSWAAEAPSKQIFIHGLLCPIADKPSQCTFKPISICCIEANDVHLSSVRRFTKTSLIFQVLE